jgi:hypothetical protein
VLDPSDDTIRYDTGIDGLPTFRLTERAKIMGDVSIISPDYMLFPDFSILVTVKPAEQRGGYLFSVVDPFEIVMQLGLSITDSESGLQNIYLHYSDYRTRTTAKPIVKFTVPNMVDKWTRFALSVRGNTTDLYFNCVEYDSVTTVRTPVPLPLDAGSTLYIGQGGGEFNGKYLVSRIENWNVIRNVYRQCVQTNVSSLMG